MKELHNLLWKMADKYDVIDVINYDDTDMTINGGAVNVVKDSDRWYRIVGEDGETVSAAGIKLIAINIISALVMMDLNRRF